MGANFAVEYSTDDTQQNEEALEVAMALVLQPASLPKQAMHTRPETDRRENAGGQHEAPLAEAPLAPSRENVPHTMAHIAAPGSARPLSVPYSLHPLAGSTKSVFSHSQEVVRLAAEPGYACGCMHALAPNSCVVAAT